MPAAGDDPGGRDVPASVAARAEARAIEAVHAVTRTRIYDARRHLWWREPSSLAGHFHRHPYDHLWPYANAWSAFCAAASMPEPSGEAVVLLDRFPDGLRAYGDTRAPARGYQAAVVRPLGPGGHRYYDDNAWLGLAMVRHAEVTGDTTVFSTARAVLSFVVSGWSTEPGVQPGGVRWRDVPSSRARHVCSTAPGVQLAVALARTTGEQSLLDWGVRGYDWTRHALGDGRGLYFDRITPEGEVERARFTYNQGAMIGAGVQLAEATGDPAYLGHARETARAALSRFDLAALLDSAPWFNAIYFRNLFLLAAALLARVDPGDNLHAQVVAAATAYADAAWESKRNRRTGLYEVGRSALNATAPMIEVDALLAGAPPRP